MNKKDYWNLIVCFSAGSAIHVGVLPVESVGFLFHGLVRRGGVCVRQLSLRGLLLSKRKGYHNTTCTKDHTYCTYMYLIVYLPLLIETYSTYI